QPDRNGLRQAQGSPAAHRSQNHRRPLASNRQHLRPLLPRGMLELSQSSWICARLNARCSSAAAALALIVAPAAAQDDTMTPIETPAQPTAIALGTGPLPGATTPESWHSQYGSVFARNVTEATLTPFLPPEGKGSGAAVIVAPGGGFRSLSMENEGWD